MPDLLAKLDRLSALKASHTARLQKELALTRHVAAAALRENAVLKERVRLYHLEGTPDDHNQEDHGNWANGGEKDDKGEGQRAETISAVGITLEEWLAKVHKLRTDNVTAVAKLVGIPEGVSIEVVDDRPQMLLEGMRYEIGGQYDPATNTIRIYNGSFKDDNTVDPGIVAHEIQHSKFNYWRKWAVKEHRALMAMETVEMEKFFNPGRGLTTEGESRFRYYASWRRFRDDSFQVALERDDGVTSYSKSWWDSYKNNVASFEHTTDETLAEIARLKTQYNPALTKEWRRLYDEINKLTRRKK